MKESFYDQKIVKAAERELRGSVVIRHEDKFQKNIPDIEIMFLDRTSWFEVKVINPGDTYKKKCKLGQCVFGDKLARVCGGRAWIIVFNEIRNRTEVWKPAVLAAYVWPQLCGLALSENDRDPWLEAEGLDANVAITAIKKAYARAAA